ncbi:MAG: bifunctional nuclease family protein [Gemmatimonadota bacterium]
MALREAQHVIARECGFPDWQALREELGARREQAAPRRLVVDAVDYAPDQFVPVQILQVDLRVSPQGHAAAYILLGDGDGRGLIIACGESRGMVLELVLSGRVPPRPPTHELLDACLRHLGCAVRSVVVHALRESTFHAHVHLGTPSGDLTVDARPSDGLILAARQGAPIQVTRAVMNQAGHPLSEAAETIARMRPLDEET